MISKEKKDFLESKGYTVEGNYVKKHYTCSDKIILFFDIESNKFCVQTLEMNLYTVDEAKELSEKLNNIINLATFLNDDSNFKGRE